MRTANLLLLSCFVSVLCAAESTQAENESPPVFEETRYGKSLSSALKVIKGESDGIVEDVVLLDDNTLVELDAPFGRHEAYIFFRHVGCKEAVPILISSLKGYHDEKAKEPKYRSCTWLHLWSALKAQTGEDFVFDKAAWQAWWDAKGKDMPETFFEDNVREAKKANQVPEPMPLKRHGSS